jgi:hypothetical protein
MNKERRRKKKRKMALNKGGEKAVLRERSRQRDC